MKRKLVSLLLVAAMTVSLTACGGSSDSGDTSQSGSTTQDSDGGSGDAAGGEEGAGTTVSGEAVSTEVTNSVPKVESAYANSATTKHESITIIPGGDPGNLLPVDTHMSGKEILDNVFERLYVINGFGGDLLPAVAADNPAEAGTDDDGNFLYDITIHDNIYDSDGNNLTAADVVFSYDYLVNNSSPHNMGKLVSVEAADTYTVRFHCQELNGVSDYGNLFAQQWVFTEKAFNDHEFANDPVGTGPYKVTNYTEGSQVDLEARDDYWNEGSAEQLAVYCANVQKVIYKITTDGTTAANMLRTGEADYCNFISETDQADFLDGGTYASDYVAYGYQENLTYYLLPNCDENSALSDENLRKAIMYAVDGATIALASGNSTAQVVYDLYNSKFPEYRDSWYTEDNFYTNPSLETAAEYLAQSSYDGSEIVLFTTDAPPALKNVGEVIATILQGIGINCKLDVQSGSIATEILSDPTAWDLEISMMAADDYGVVDVARLMDANNFPEGQGSRNFIRSDDELQRLITLCNSKEGWSDENTQALHDYIIEHAYGRGLMCTTTYNICTSDVKEMAMNFKFYIAPGGCIYADNAF